MMQHIWRRLIGREFRGSQKQTSKNRPHRRPLRMEPLEERRLLAITVNTLVDEADGSLVDGDVSLRDAIALAPAGEIIDFAPALTSGGAVTINLTVASPGHMIINKALTIMGPGANLLTIDASGLDPSPNVNNGDGKRVFVIDDGTATNRAVSIQGLTITGADSGANGGAIYSAENLSIQDCIIRNNNGKISGGGIVAAGMLTVTNSQIYENSGVAGAGIQFQVGGNLSPTITGSTIRNNTATNRGGGILGAFSPGATGSLVISNSLIKDNIAGGDGGGVVATGSTGAAVGKLTMTGTAVISNESSTNGGGIVVDGPATIGNSFIAENSALLGGGLYTASTGAITSTTFANNTATNDGGGVYALLANTVFTQVTVSGNKANRNGGGVYAQQGITFNNSTIANNRADFDGAGGGGGGGAYYVDAINPNDANRSVLLNHTIVGNNGRGTGDLAPPDDLSSGGAAAPGNQFALRYGWVETTAGFNQRMGATFTPFTVGTDPGLEALADNGGGPSYLGGYRLLTHELAPTSGAIDIGDPASAAGGASFPTNDQRGAPYRRLVNKTTGASPGIIDLGATEYLALVVVGDFNDNGTVDAADYTLWRDTLGATVTAGTGADASGNSTVDQADYDLWKTNFGQLSGSGAGGGSSASFQSVVDNAFTDGGSEPSKSDETPVTGGGSAPAASARVDQALVAWLASQSSGGGSDDEASTDALDDDGDTTVDALDAALELVFAGVGSSL